ncbi:MAG: PLP-dependent aminotransferase family protein [Thermocladium sp.]|jgi:2-aminoadipate transaminase
MMDIKSLLSERTQFMKASDIRELLKWVTEDVISLGGGMPDPSTFPRELADIARDVIITKGSSALQYGKTEGVDDLKDELIRFMAKDGIKASREEIIITTGSQEALDLIGRITINAGDAVITERPTYLAALQAFKAYRPRIIGVDMDSDGMIMTKLEDAIRKSINDGNKIKFIYVIPTCQNPTGISMSIDRRKHLMELASKYDLLIVEDNPYSYFLFDGIYVPPLKSMDTENRVIYMSTFSKIIAPGIRVGWVVGDKDLIRWIAMAKQAVDLHTSTLSQYIALEALRRGIIERNIPKIREAYKVKRDAMLDALAKYMPEQVTWTRPIGGMFVWASAQGIRTEDMLPMAVSKYKVAYVPGKSFYPDEDVHTSMRLNFTYPSVDMIYEGIRRLSNAIKEELSKNQH